MQASSYPLSNDVFSRADYCLFTGCILFDRRCWINTTNSVNVTCREGKINSACNILFVALFLKDDVSQSSTEIVSPSSSSASVQYTAASSSTIIKGKLFTCFAPVVITSFT